MNTTVKRIILSAALGLSWLAFCYASAAFIAWEPNPGRWPDIGRFLFAWLGGAGSIGSGVGLYFSKEQS